LARTGGGRLWMQLYLMRDRRVTESIIERAENAGYEALVVTTDANVFGNREWDRRNYSRPGRPTWRNIMDLTRHPRWVFEVLARHGAPVFENIKDFVPIGEASSVGGSTVIPRLFTSSITWDDICWLRRLWRGKLLVKGVLSVSDALRAAAIGCDGIVLSNHGGRQLDHCVSPLEILSDVVNAIRGRMCIIIDSGFRRGTDVVKALALGANAVMIGRATLYGLAAGGEAGAVRALAILAEEIDRTLGQLGCRSLAELGPHVLRRIPSTGSQRRLECMA
jgi:(S)-mandelate dehydrogenase